MPAVLLEHETGVALLNCDAGDLARGERGFINDPARREDAERAFSAAADLAEVVGARTVNLLVGRMLPGVRETRQRSAIVDALRAIAPMAAARGIAVVLEPLNEQESPGYMAPTADAAASLVEASGSDAVRLLLDVYHVARSGQDPVAVIERHAGMIGHVQLSDHPGRRRPGSGSLQVSSIVDALEAAGYDGVVGLEYQPDGDTRESLRELYATEPQLVGYKLQ